MKRVLRNGEEVDVPDLRLMIRNETDTQVIGCVDWVL